MDLSQPDDVRLLLKKLWCHGQAVSPVQGFAYAFWAISRDSEISYWFKILLWVAALKFPLVSLSFKICAIFLYCWCPSTMSYNITSIAHNHHTDILLLKTVGLCQLEGAAKRIW